MPIHILFILINLARYHEQKPSLINHEIFSLNAAELSTLMHVEGTDNVNFRSHFRIIKLIRHCFLWLGKIATNHFNVHLKTE